MSTPIQVSAVLADTDNISMSFETGHLAQQANGAIMSSLGKTQVLVTATAARKTREGADFFPLTVDIEEKMYAAGKIPGSFFRREGRAGEVSILTARLTDRSIRPCFPSDFRNEVHVVATIMGADQENPYDVLAINAASLALSISDIPFSGPIGAVKLAYGIDGKWIAYPTYTKSQECSFELVVAGRTLDNDDVAIMMVEAASNEGAFKMRENGAPNVEESVLAEGLELAKKHIREVIELQRQLMVTAGVKIPFEYEPQADYSPEIYAEVKEIGSDQIASSFAIADRAERSAIMDKAKLSIVETLTQRHGEEAEVLTEVSSAVRALNKELVREHIVSNKVRIDARKTDEIRDLSASVGVLKVTHGSALFQRGDTQVMNIATLGTHRMDQLIDGIDPTERKRFMHHYNFPPFSTGEAGFMRGPKRREIGHGALAEKAISGVLPTMEEFPYTIRLVSEVLSSNGSTSMASVCSSSLSLMDAGVPISSAVAGIAMGLIYEGGEYVTLTDILGEEDAYGDMDFKVAGTEDTVTALQMDTKIDGIPSDVLASALEQAKTARLKILEVMNSALSTSRDDVNENAPKILSFEIPIDKVGEVIGPKGKVINGLQEKTGAEISVDDEDGKATVTISSTSREVIEAAEKEIQLILNPPEAELGETYTGEVVNITNFGAFVSILPGTDGLLHISKLGGGKRLDRVEEVLSLGDTVTVVVDEVEKGDRGGQRVALTLVEGGTPTPAGSRSSSDRGGSDRGDRSRNSRGGSGRDNRSGSGRDNRSGSGRDRSGSGRDNRSGSGRGSGRDNRSGSGRDGNRRRSDRGNNGSRNSDNRGSGNRNSGNTEEVSFSDSFNRNT